MSEIAVGTRRRRRKPPRGLLTALAWLIADVTLLAVAVFRMASGHASPAYVLIVAIALFLLPPEWWLFKRELARWRDGR